jgi:N-acetyl-alpha-D-glucosaminyl L-malate synthase BshA
VSESLRIGISCYPTFGGSGIVATELGLALAQRGHQVHFICSALPRRYPQRAGANLFFHEVKAPSYPLFGGDNQYALALTSKMVEASREANLDLLHVHYAIPHAVSGLLARQVVEAAGRRAPKLVTTLHGTDITVVGGDPSFLPVTRFAIEASDAITTPSRYLRAATYAQLGIDPSREIEVIPNFVDTSVYLPDSSADMDPNRPPLVLHNSNFRPLKRVLDVIRIFALARKALPCELALIGDGPDRAVGEQLVETLGLTDSVKFLGEQLDIPAQLRRARAFLLPSESESFGLAALEAMSCGVPVVSSNAGGLSEVNEEGESGFLADVGDLETMSAKLVRLLEDDGLHANMSQAAREIAERRFQLGPAVDRYLDCYRRALGR